MTLRYHLKTYHGSQFIRGYEEGIFPIYFESMDENLVVVQCVSSGDGDANAEDDTRFSAHGNFSCGYCMEDETEDNKIFSNDVALELHLKKNCKRVPKDATMTCLLCQSQDLPTEEQNFTSIVRLREHIEEHLKSYKKSQQRVEVRWQCQVESCKFFTNRDIKDIINHVESVHGLTRESGAVWLRCPFCTGVQSADAATLERHLRISHSLSPQQILSELAITSIPVALKGDGGVETVVPFVPLFSSRKLPTKPKGSEEGTVPKVVTVVSDAKKKTDAGGERSKDSSKINSHEGSGSRQLRIALEHKTDAVPPSHAMDVYYDSQILVPQKSFFNVPNLTAVSFLQYPCLCFRKVHVIIKIILGMIL